jgi:hypothetical protein
MKKQLIIDRLKNDEEYYGEFGKQYLSNSNIQDLLTNPLNINKPSEPSVNMLVGSYFHTAVLEPEKLGKYKIVKASNRNTNIYKNEVISSNEEILLLHHEVEEIELLVNKIKENEFCQGLLYSDNNDYEIPNITEIDGLLWKGKADVVNHSEKLIIDLKTTSSLDDFRYSAKKYNYDSQAYIYKKLFDYDLVFMVIDKKTHRIGIYDCSEDFMLRGRAKVEMAINNYNLFFNDPHFEPKNYFINETL